MSLINTFSATYRQRNQMAVGRNILCKIVNTLGKNPYVRRIYGINHIWGFALVCLNPRNEGGMHDFVVNGTFIPGDAILWANP